MLPSTLLTSWQGPPALAGEEGERSGGCNSGPGAWPCPGLRGGGGSASPGQFGGWGGRESYLRVLVWLAAFYKYMNSRYDMSRIARYLNLERELLLSSVPSLAFLGVPVL